MEAEAVQEERADMRQIRDVVDRVYALVPGRLEWIAKQTGFERDDVYGFVIGRSFATVTVEEARNVDDALIHRLATEVMGYEPGSLQDLAWHQHYAEQQRDELNNQIQKLMAQSDGWHRTATNLEAQIKALPEYQPPESGAG